MKYHKKPIDVFAFQFGTESEPDWIMPYYEAGKIGNYAYKVGTIHSHNGVQHLIAGDWIILGVGGEIYGCPDSVFKQTYEAVEE